MGWVRLLPTGQCLADFKCDGYAASQGIASYGTAASRDGVTGNMIR